MTATVARTRVGEPGYHVVVHRVFDLDGMEQAAAADDGPRHTLWEVKEQLGATVHQPPRPEDIRWYDRLAAKVVFTPEIWAQGRQVSGAMAGGDVVLLNDGVGFVIGLYGLLRRRRYKICMGVTWPENRKFVALARWLGMKRFVSVFSANTPAKAEAIRRNLKVPSDKVVAEPEQTDLRFFRPADEPFPPNRPPFIFSAGREGRDYATLGEAVRGLDVEVSVCAVSPSTTDPNTLTVPDPMPANMRFEPLEWRAFREAYQRAEVVVVPVIDRPDSPGLTVIMEALACARPVVTTTTTGYVEELVAGGYVRGVPPHDPAALRAAIEDVLAHPDEAAAMGRRGYELMQQRHASELLVEAQVTKARRVGAA